MKKLFILVISLVIMSSCNTTKVAKSSRAELRKEQKLLSQEMVKNAVESKKYIIKFDRIYFSYGGIIELIPRANFIIIDGERAILNTAYLGRQFDIKPIAAIDIRGKAVDYALTDNLSKGSYEVKMKVNNGGSNSFEIFIRISKDGYCSTSISSLKIDNVTYAGHLVPIANKTETSPQEGNPI